MPGELQAELLDWLDEQDEPPRLLAGTRDLAGDDRASGRLLEEFHAACNVLEIRLPPLRERLEDLPRLGALLLRREVADGTTPPEIAPETFELFRRHSWPGNLRQLAQTLRDGLIASAGGRIEPAHLPLEFRVTPARPSKKTTPPLDTILEQIETRLIRLALEKAKGNKAEAAERLGLTRGRLLRRIEALKIE